jgi:SHS2 domain-containing protein
MDQQLPDKTDSSSDPPDWIEALDHTADAGILIRANDLPELFARAAWGMFSVITNVGTVKPAEKTRVAVEASDRHALMVKWLSELNYRHVIEHRLFCRFTVSITTEERVEADVYGEKTDHERHTVYTEIKAITFHDLKIDYVNDGWVAKIIFDL